MPYTRKTALPAISTPETLLYLYLRHALTLGYYDSSYNLHRSAGFLSTVQLAAMKPEPTFVHVADAPGSESRFAALYKTEPRITSSPTLLVSDYITRTSGYAALNRKTWPISCVSRRFSSRVDRRLWSGPSPSTSIAAATAMTRGCSGLVRYQLEQMRAAAPSERR